MKPACRQSCCIRTVHVGAVLVLNNVLSYTFTATAIDTIKNTVYVRTGSKGLSSTIRRNNLETRPTEVSVVSKLLKKPLWSRLSFAKPSGCSAEKKQRSLCLRDTIWGYLTKENLAPAEPLRRELFLLMINPLWVRLNYLDNLITAIHPWHCMDRLRGCANTINPPQNLHKLYTTYKLLPSNFPPGPKVP